MQRPRAMASRRTTSETRPIAEALAGVLIEHLRRLDRRVALALGAAVVIVAAVILLPGGDDAAAPVALDATPVAAAEAPSGGVHAGTVPSPSESSPNPVGQVAKVTEPAASAPAVPPPAWNTVTVRRGDTMELIFRRLGLSPRLLHDIVHLDANGKTLIDLRPGDEIAFDLTGDGQFRALKTEFDDQRWLFIEQGEAGLASRLEMRDLETRIVEVQAEINSSLFNAGKDVGLSDNMILRLAGIFGWDIDFALDIRRGDRFALVYEEVWRDGEFLRQGDILAARFINQGDSFEAVRFDAGDGADFYDPKGRPMRKAFLRSPINFTRVSSNFNPGRLHPVTRRVRPHNGTDYAAPTGTPVWAAGDGTVLEAGYSAANGNYIFLKHGNHIVTRYLHLSKKLVKRGERVRQGQTIGRVGSTGLATGPHLHYEFLVYDKHRDPRKVDLPEATPLPSNVLPQFQNATEDMFDRLDELLPPRILLAGATPAAGTPDTADDPARSRTGTMSAPK